MDITDAMRAVMKQYDLTEPMVRAIYSGRNRQILNCGPRTEKALVDRGIMHPVNSDLTDRGMEVLTALQVAQGTVATTPAPAREPIEGGIVTTAGTTKGSLPKHADHPDARAAIQALNNLKLAELTNHFDPEEGADVRGFMVEPRGHGRVAVYWVFAGRIRDHNGNPFKVELQIAADKLSKAGWRIESKSVFCVFAWRPISEIAEEPSTPDGWTPMPVHIHAGDLVEAKTATVNGEPKTITVRVDRTPWLVNHRTTALSDGAGLIPVFTDTLRVVDETSASPVLPTLEESAAAAKAFFATQPREVLHEEVIYTLQTRQPGGEWQHLYTPHAAKTLDEAQETIDDIKALSEPGWEYRPVEVRRTLTALPHQPAAAADVEPGSVPARKLRSGYRIRIRGEERHVWKVTFDRQARYLRVYTVPPKGENPEFWAYGMGVNDTAELIAVGPAVDITSQLVDAAH
ncbi:hypothetical protein FE633_17295 [Streptomyces montanus]|uniref:Uncharacterized protein n=1 Tax=Streptomyces montanus TaxID=2580423 RepID=A0A5R9FVJ4_9ACTN|nr:hypothetical protein [Streptomyces montanus]TLS44903.1 hypothetical protein FE633_17295 [Streptomyces montanus]